MLDNWLRPLDSQQFKDFINYTEHQFANRIIIYKDELPSLADVDAAIVSIDADEALPIRQSLYAKMYAFSSLKVADLGSVRKKDPLFIIPIIKELLESKIIPIIIGNSVELTLPHYQAYQFQNLVNLVSVDEKIRLALGAESPEDYLNDILLSKKPRLFNLGIIGYQTHFVPYETVQYLDDHNFDHFRLGNVRASIMEMEPIIRDADMMSFNIAALKMCEAPGQKAPTPSGFFSEEACQITRYAGMSDKLTSIGFYGYDPSKDNNNQTAQVIAQLIWYFLDGLSNRKHDYPASLDGLTEYIVGFKSQNYTLTFWKSNRSGRWWLQVPFRTKKKHKRHRLIPCSYQDYQLACREDFPDRLLNAFKRFS
ncbi:MAG: arginase family protein [Saprospiraceae bacterium]